MAVDLIKIGTAIGVLVILLLLYYAIFVNKSTSLTDAQAQIANINQQVSTMTANINTLMQAVPPSPALNNFLTSSDTYYKSNQASMKSINDVVSSLNAYSTANLFTKDDLTQLVNAVNAKLQNLQKAGFVSHKGYFSATDTADQIAATVANIKQQLITQTLNYMQTSQQFAGVIQSTISSSIGTTAMQPAVASAINALISSGQLTITSANINDFQTAANAAINTAIGKLTSTNIPDFQSATLAAITSLNKSGQLSINSASISDLNATLMAAINAAIGKLTSANIPDFQAATQTSINALAKTPANLALTSANLGDFNIAVNNLIAASTTQQQLAATQAQLAQLTITVGNYINALQGGTITISATDIAKLYTVLPDNQTYYGNNIGGQCGTYSDLYSAYAACNVNGACVGFTTITVPGSSGTTAQVPACLKTNLTGGVQTANPTSGVSEGSSFKAIGSLYQTYIKNGLAGYAPENNYDYSTPQNISCYSTPNTNTIMDAANACNANSACAGFSVIQDAQGNWRPNCLKGSLYYKSSNTGETFFSKGPLFNTTMYANTDSKGNEIKGVLPNIEASCKSSGYSAAPYTPQEAQFWCSVNPNCKGFSVANGAPQCFYSDVSAANQVATTGTTLYGMNLKNGVNNTYNQNLAINTLNPSIQNPFNNVLLIGQTLTPGQNITSANGQYWFGLTPSGQLGITSIGVMWMWILPAYANSKLVFQTNGDLQLLDSGSNLVWETATTGKNPSYLVMQNDGNVVMYDVNGKQLWSYGPNSPARRSANTTGLTQFSNTGTYQQGYIYNPSTGLYLQYDPTKSYASNTTNNQFGNALTTTGALSGNASLFSLNLGSGAISLAGSTNCIDDYGSVNDGDTSMSLYQCGTGNNNQIYTYDPINYKVGLKNKTNKCMDTGGVNWQFMGCYTNEGEFGSDKVYNGGSWPTYQGNWKGAPTSYVAVSRDASSGTNNLGWGYQWNNKPNLVSSGGNSCQVKCSDSNAWCGTSTASGKQWAVYQRVPAVHTWTCNGNANQTLQFLPQASLQ